MTRTRRQPPSPFVSAWIPRLASLIPAPRAALDIACGRGRHSRLLARRGFDTFAVDRDLARVQALHADARAGQWPVRVWAADLEQIRLPEDRFDLVLGTNYLQRDLWPALRQAVTPGGFLVYETFTTGQRRHGRGPRSPDHLLRPAELREVATGWSLLYYAEDDGEAAQARLVAQKPPRGRSLGQR